MTATFTPTPTSPKARTQDEADVNVLLAASEHACRVYPGLVLVRLLPQLDGLPAPGQRRIDHTHVASLVAKFKDEGMRRLENPIAVMLQADSIASSDEPMLEDSEGDISWLDEAGKGLQLSALKPGSCNFVVLAGQHRIAALHKVYQSSNELDGKALWWPAVVLRSEIMQPEHYLARLMYTRNMQDYMLEASPGDGYRALWRGKKSGSAPHACIWKEARKTPLLHDHYRILQRSTRDIVPLTEKSKVSVLLGRILNYPEYTHDDLALLFTYPDSYHLSLTALVSLTASQGGRIFEDTLKLALLHHQLVYGLLPAHSSETLTIEDDDANFSTLTASATPENAAKLVNSLECPIHTGQSVAAFRKDVKAKIPGLNYGAEEKGAEAKLEAILAAARARIPGRQVPVLRATSKLLLLSAPSMAGKLVSSWPSICSSSLWLLVVRSEAGLNLAAPTGPSALATGHDIVELITAKASAHSVLGSSHEKRKSHVEHFIQLCLDAIPKLAKCSFTCTGDVLRHTTAREIVQPIRKLLEGSTGYSGTWISTTSRQESSSDESVSPSDTESESSAVGEEVERSLIVRPRKGSVRNARSTVRRQSRIGAVAEKVAAIESASAASKSPKKIPGVLGKRKRKASPAPKVSHDVKISKQSRAPRSSHRPASVKESEKTPEEGKGSEPATTRLVQALKELTAPLNYTFKGLSDDGTMAPHISKALAEQIIESLDQRHWFFKPDKPVNPSV